MEKVTFNKPEDLFFIDNDGQILLRRGALHVNELTIDAEGSSRSFIEKLRRLLAVGFLEIDEDDDDFEDFSRLLRFGFIAISSKRKFLVITSNELLNAMEDLSQMDSTITVMGSESILSRQERIALNESSKPLNIASILETVEEKIASYGVVYVGLFMLLLHSVKYWRCALSTRHSLGLIRSPHSASGTTIMCILRMSNHAIRVVTNVLKIIFSQSFRG